MYSPSTIIHHLDLDLGVTHAGRTGGCTDGAEENFVALIHIFHEGGFMSSSHVDTLRCHPRLNPLSY